MLLWNCYARSEIIRAVLDFDAQAKDEGQLFPESDPQNMAELFDLLSTDPSWLNYCLDSSVASLEQELFARKFGNISVPGFS